MPAFWTPDLLPGAALPLDQPLRGMLVVGAAVLGAIVGSFLNVVIHRVPAGESVVRPRSRCPHCATPVAARDNVPVLSWLMLRGRCRACRHPLGWRYPAVEVSTAAAFAALTAVVGLRVLLPALLYLAAISIALALIDLEHHRLPDAIVLPAYPVLAALLVPVALAADRPGLLLRALIGAVALFAFYFLLMAVNPNGMGFGDVKLAGVLGMVLGLLGWGQWLVGLFAGFFLGGLVGVGLMALHRAGRKTMIPFGPYMLAGAWLALLWGGGLTDWYLARTLA